MKRQKMIRIATVTSLVLLLGVPALRAQQSRAEAKAEAKGQRGQFSERDFKFVTEVARGGMAEVQLGELAKQKGASQSVRSFGERMVTDHNKANDELKQIVTQKGAALPAELSQHERSSLEKLEKATGKDFDKVYAKDMVRDHKKDVKEFQNAAKDCNDPDLRAFAQKTLPTLQEHLRLAQEMETAVKGEK